MKNDVLSSIKENQTINPVQARIKLFYDNGYRSKEIAAVTDLPKKLIKSISKGECVPEGGDCKRLMLHFDEAIARLNINKPILRYEPSPDADINTEHKTTYKLDVKSVTIYKGTDDNKMIVQIHGIIMK